MKRKNTSKKVIRIPIMVPIILLIIFAIIITTIFGRNLIMKAARYVAVEESMTDTKITASEITADNYGAYVTNYVPENGSNVGWRIFHSDGENIYLIADDYVEIEHIPNGKNGTAVEKNYYSKRGVQLSPYVDYTGSVDIPDIISTKWMKQYLETGRTSTELSMREIAYLLDINAWSGFANDKYTDYAIGAPTLELFVASYNTTHPDKTILTEISAYSYGYKEYWSTGDTGYVVIIDVEDELYGVKNSKNASATWIASHYNDDSLKVMKNDGFFQNYAYQNYIVGLRPVVALKSEAALERQEDGTYLIVENETTDNKTTEGKIAASDYGAYVTNYVPENGSNVGWRIFYSDEENIYLIADDFIDRSYVPAGKGGTTYNASPTFERGFSLEASADYEGWADISGTDISNKWLSQYVAAGYTSTEFNMKATAYLLDTNAWSGFANSNYAEYAIGGPTLEMFAASYNATHTEKTIQTQASSSIGYKVKWSTDSNYSTFISGLNTSESLYLISSGNTNKTASCMWLASPSNSGADRMMNSTFHGHVDYGEYSCVAYGARPIVVLKSEVEIEKQEDGTYKIVGDEEIQISSEKYNVEDSYITKIQPNTTVENFKANLLSNASEINIYNSNEEILEDSNIIATGIKLKMLWKNETRIYNLVVIGDATGDGEADFKDLAKVNLHRLNKTSLQGEYLLAADVNQDGVADFKDLVKINRFRLHKIAEL